MIQLGADDLEEALVCALEKGNYKIIKFLHKYGANLDHRDLESTFSSLANYGQFGIIKFFFNSLI